MKSIRGGINLRKRLISAFKRNSLLLLVTSLTISAFIYYTVYTVILVKLLNPTLIEDFMNFLSANYPAKIPKPETHEFFMFIFMNNTRFYWNPLNMLVWIPLFGALIIGFSFLLNGVVIGAVAAMLGLKYGPLLPIVGLAPHGIIEVPAFIIQCTAILRWHITISTLLFNLIRREKVEKAKVKEDLMDVVILSAISIFLLFIAALIETYVTPSLIKLVEKNVEEFRLQSQPFL